MTNEWHTRTMLVKMVQAIKCLELKGWVVTNVRNTDEMFVYELLAFRPDSDEMQKLITVDTGGRTTPDIRSTVDYT